MSYAFKINAISKRKLQNLANSLKISTTSLQIAYDTSVIINNIPH